MILLLLLITRQNLRETSNDKARDVTVRRFVERCGMVCKIECFAVSGHMTGSSDCSISVFGTEADISPVSIRQPSEPRKRFTRPTARRLLIYL